MSLGALLSLLTAPAAGLAPEPRQLTLAAGPQGIPASTVLITLGARLAQDLPGLGVRVETPAAGAAENVRIVGGNPRAVGYAGSPVVHEAARGEGPFSGNAIPLRTLAPLWDITYHLVTIEGSGVVRLADLRGKRISAGPANTPVSRDAMRILVAAGIDPGRDVQVLNLAFSDLIRALEERQIDAFFYADVGVPPLPGIFRLAMSPDVRMRLIPLDSAVPVLQQTFGRSYIQATIQREHYPSLTADVPTVAGYFMLVVRVDFDAGLAYQITRLLYTHRLELARVSKEAQYISLNGVAGRSPVPFHPGAIRYFRERELPGF
ncbi:MAG TPA: TAXI family TRAP transporter solute-binding subunit [bacterium]|nr:TAXI family TRAP transporter solute-binding subunit [bacterium]